ncbi:MAG: response regulator transcription factor [Trueperaceae bacterium]
MWVKEEIFSLAESKTKNFLNLLSDLLYQEVTEGFFQELLDLTIHEIASAQAGSLMVLQNERYHFVAATGYDLKELQHITLSLEESILFSHPCQDSYVLSNFQTFNETKLDEERAAIFLNAGEVTTIKETLLIPVRQQGQTVAMVYLDNFERKNVFRPYEIETAEELGVIFGLGIKFQSYQQQLSVYQEFAAETQIEKEGLKAHLTPRQKDVLLNLAEGLNNKEIAKKLQVSEYTIGDHLKKIYLKIGVHSRSKAREWARDNKHSLG